MKLNFIESLQDKRNEEQFKIERVELWKMSGRMSLR